MRPAVFLSALLVISVSALSAEVLPVAEGVVRYLCSDADGTAHPRSLELEQRVELEPESGATETLLVLNYVSNQEGEPRPGRVLAVVEVERGGERFRLDRFRMKTDPVSGDAGKARSLPGTLLPGDRVLWKLRFRGFRALRADRCVSIFTSVAPVKEGTP